MQTKSVRSVDLYMDRTVHIFWFVDLYGDRTIQTLWYVDLCMDRTVHIMSGIGVVYGPYSPHDIWKVGKIWTLGARLGHPGGEAPQ